MIKRKIKTNTGFIALMSAIIISVILLLIVTNLSFTGFYGRSDILDSELKERSSALAEACVDTALLNLAQNVNYIGDVIVELDKCTIQSVAGGGSIKTIKVKADYKNYITNLQVLVDSTNDMAVVSWEETTN